MKEEKKATGNGTPERPECFVIMPFRNPAPYPDGHFQRVFDDILSPACDQAGFRAVKANDVAETNLIHLDMLRRLLDSEMVLCDLSSQNPNVFFELGLRQAFDKPVVIVQDELTERAFDTNLLRGTPYRSKRLYNEVLEDQKAIAKALTETASKRHGSVNSIIQLLQLTKAKIPDGTKLDDSTQVLLNQMLSLRDGVQTIVSRLTQMPSIAPDGTLMTEGDKARRIHLEKMRFRLSSLKADEARMRRFLNDAPENQPEGLPLRLSDTRAEIEKLESEIFLLGKSWGL